MSAGSSDSGAGGGASKLAFQVLFSAAGLFALAYGFGYLALRASLNQIGLSGDLLSLGSLEYASAVLPFALASVFIGSLALAILAPLVLAARGILRRIGWDLTWRPSGVRPSLLRRLTLLAASLVIFLAPAARLVEVRGLLLPAAAKLDAATCLVVHSGFRGDRILVFSLQLLTLVLLAVGLRKLRAATRPGGAASLALALTALAGGGLLAMSYGQLIDSYATRGYRPAILHLSQEAFPSLPAGAGYPITHTASHVVFFAWDGRAPEGRVVVVSRELAGLELSGPQVPLFERLDQARGGELERRCSGEEVQGMIRRLRWLLIAAFLGGALAALAERSAAQDPSAAAGEPKKTVETPPPASRQPAPPGALPLLERFYPLVRELGARAADFLDDLLAMTRGSGPDAGEPGGGDVWRYELAAGAPRRITSGGGYGSVRAAPGGRIAFLRHGALGLMDAAGGDQRMLDPRRRYRSILGWDEAAGEFLLAAADGRLLRLRTGGEALEEEELPAGSRYLSLEALAALAQTSDRRTRLRVVEEDGEWRILADREDYEEAKALHAARHRIFAPSWLPEEQGILFLAEVGEEAPAPSDR